MHTIREGTDGTWAVGYWRDETHMAGDVYASRPQWIDVFRIPHRQDGQTKFAAASVASYLNGGAPVDIQNFLKGGG